MQEMQTVIVLLSVIVGILSLVIIVMLGMVIALLVKARQLTRRVDAITANVARATEWLSPAKVVGEIARLFNKGK